MASHNGFSLIELMIVVAIIAIIAAFAIPSLIGSRIAANEAAAIQSLRTIHTAQVHFQSSAYVDVDGDGTGDFATSLAQLHDPLGDGSVHPIDSGLADGSKSGYMFVMNTTLGNSAAGTPPTFTCQANPISPRLGRRYLYLDERGAIYFTYAGPILDPATASPLT